MYTPFHFSPPRLPPNAAQLREEVREFIAGHCHKWSGWLRGHGWTAFDRDFSKALGQRGWIGMTWPKAYGGAERSMLERYIVLEELLAAGAPVGAHWIADRQQGPLILRVGTEEQKQRYLPAIARGEVSFCIGLSEPDSGSDLASIRTRADRSEGGWKINGRKIWTTNAHLSEYMVALVRTGASPADRQAGLSQFIIDMKSPGVGIRQIKDLTGEAHFNEITFDDVQLGDDALVGQVGSGWEQVTAELAFERSGSERFMSTVPLLPLVVDQVAASGGADRLAAVEIGKAMAELAVMREMSVSIAGMLAEGETPNQEAAVVKELGATYEQRLPELVRQLARVPIGEHSASELGQMMAAVVQLAPTFSLRGGTREIVRGIIARGIGLR